MSSHIQVDDINNLEVDHIYRLEVLLPRFSLHSGILLSDSTRDKQIQLSLPYRGREYKIKGWGGSEHILPASDKMLIAFHGDTVFAGIDVFAHRGIVHRTDTDFNDFLTFARLTAEDKGLEYSGSFSFKGKAGTHTEQLSIRMGKPVPLLDFDHLSYVVGRAYERILEYRSGQ